MPKDYSFVAWLELAIEYLEKANKELKDQPEFHIENMEIENITKRLDDLKDYIYKEKKLVDV